MKTKSILLFFALVFCANINTTHAQVNVQDSLALVDLYDSTHGLNWRQHDNWLTSNPVLTWYGITVTNTRVTEINLTYNNLTGSIPSSIGSLVNLQHFYLDHNQLSGSIPSSIGSLVNLQFLHLYDNHLSGSIPSSIGNLVNLHVLWLDGNHLSGSIPSSIGGLVNPWGLNLGGNQLNGSIPSSIGNLINLGELSLYNNQLSGNIPTSIGNLINLVYLLFDHNQLSGSIPSSISNLNIDDENESLALDNNHFTFDGMELVAQTFPDYLLYYSPQSNISIHQNSNSLSVYAGGTLSNNTYKWYSVERNDTITIVGDSVFHPSQRGYYFAAVTNSVCTQLTLHTDTIFYDAALPVTIINLKAQRQKSIIRIDWISVSEINVAGYEIQRSSNALSFSNIGSLTAKVNGTQKVNYTFNDVHPLHGDNYYRIKAVDKDGKTTYSNTVLVNMGNDKIITVVYPNPAKDILHVETNGSVTFSLINQSGKILLTININGKGIINVSGISDGLYYLKNNSTGNVQKVVIAR